MRLKNKNPVTAPTQFKDKIRLKTTRIYLNSFFQPNQTNLAQFKYLQMLEQKLF